MRWFTDRHGGDSWVLIGNMDGKGMEHSFVLFVHGFTAMLMLEPDDLRHKGGTLKHGFQQG